MGKPISSDVQRSETFAFRTRVNKEVLESFKSCLAYKGYPMNVILELFMEQYYLKRIALDEEEVLSFADTNYDVGDLSTTFNKKIYLNFKEVCREDNLYVKHVLTAFMNKYANDEYILEYKLSKEID